MNKRPKVLALSTLACMALVASSSAFDVDGSSGDWKANGKSYKLKHSAHERSFQPSAGTVPTRPSSFPAA